jgi:hypothetical protein
LDVSRSSETNDETHENHSELTFEPMSALPSTGTSRRASFDSSVNLDIIKEVKDTINAPQFIPTNFNMSSVAKPFKPSGLAAAPYFKPSNVPASTLAPAFMPNNVPATTVAPVAAPSGESSLTSGLNALSNINNDFTPSTPYVHKFRTEMCKNFELYGKCKYGDEVSTQFN